MDKSYKILRPPLALNYQLPDRAELLKLKAGDLAKVTFQVDEDKPERMWVILTDCNSPDSWTGTIDNDATQLNTRTVLPADSEVSFHPLDIIAVE